MRTSLRIGELAGVLGTTTKTLRFYESIGLLGAAQRTDSGYRLYDEPAVNQVRLVVNLRRLGLSIEELKSLFSNADDSTFRSRLLGLLDQKLYAMDRDLGVLQGRREDLAARHLALLTTPKGRPASCVCDALLTVCSCGKAK